MKKWVVRGRIISIFLSAAINVKNRLDCCSERSLVCLEVFHVNQTDISVEVFLLKYKSYEERKEVGSTFKYKRTSSSWMGSGKKSSVSSFTTTTTSINYFMQLSRRAWMISVTRPQDQETRKVTTSSISGSKTLKRLSPHRHHQIQDQDHHVKWEDPLDPTTSLLISWCKQGNSRIESYTCTCKWETN